MIKKLAIVAGTVVMAAGLGAGSASAATAALEVAPRPVPVHRDFCDDWNHRFAPQCRQRDRWHWDGHHWQHDRWDGHRWYRR